MRPDNALILRKLALCRFCEAMQHEDVETALAIYSGVAGPHAEDREAMTRTAFHLLERNSLSEGGNPRLRNLFHCQRVGRQSGDQLSGHGHHEAAIRLGQVRLSWAPDDPVQSHLLDALAHKPLTRAPEKYIVEYFNRFAETFDAQLVNVLGYRTPENLVDLLAKTRRTFAKVLDLGCGTGLAGSHLRSLAGTLTGVDLATKMLEKAAERGVYDHLIESEIERFLDCQADRFDLVFATDVLIYFGDLAPLMRGAARALRPGGLLAFSIERARADGYVLLPMGRFAHHPSYIEELASDDFTVLEKMSAAIRLEACEPVDGMLYILQRR